MIIDGEHIITKEEQEVLNKLLENLDKINWDKLHKIDLDKIPTLCKEHGYIFKEPTSVFEERRRHCYHGICPECNKWIAFPLEGQTEKCEECGVILKRLNNKILLMEEN